MWPLHQASKVTPIATPILVRVQFGPGSRQRRPTTQRSKLCAAEETLKLKREEKRDQRKAYGVNSLPTSLQLRAQGASSPNLCRNLEVQVPPVTLQRKITLAAHKRVLLYLSGHFLRLRAEFRPALLRRPANLCPCRRG